MLVPRADQGARGREQRGGGGRWPHAGRPQATGAMGRAGGHGTEQERLFAEGSQQMQPPLGAMFAQSPGEPSSWGKIMSAAAIAAEKN